MSEEEGHAAARQCALNALAAIKKQVGALSAIKRVANSRVRRIGQRSVTGYRSSFDTSARVLRRALIRSSLSVDCPATTRYGTAILENSGHAEVASNGVVQDQLVRVVVLLPFVEGVIVTAVPRDVSPSPAGVVGVVRGRENLRGGEDP